MEGPNSALSQAYTSAPSSRTLPPAEGHKPTRVRAKVVLPDADGPTTASTSPGFNAKATPLRIGAELPGAAVTSPSACTSPFGWGSGMALAAAGTVDSS